MLFLSGGWGGRGWALGRERAQVIVWVLGGMDEKGYQGGKGGPRML